MMMLLLLLMQQMILVHWVHDNTGRRYCMRIWSILYGRSRYHWNMRVRRHNQLLRVLLVLINLMINVGELADINI